MGTSTTDPSPTSPIVAEPPRPAPVARGDGLADPQAPHALEMVPIVAVHRHRGVGAKVAVFIVDEDVRDRGRGRGEADGHRSPNVDRIRERKPSVACADVLAAQLGEPAQEIVLLVGEALRHIDVDLDEQIAATATLQHRDPAALEPEHVAGLRARRAP